MSSKNKIFLIIYFLIAIIILYWAFSIFKTRYSNWSSTNNQPTQNQALQTEHPSTENNENSSQLDNSENEKSDDTIENENNNEFLEITKEDCDNECTDFNNSQDKKYCQQICGLTPTEANKENNCDNKKDLEKDYCWKNLAIAKDDFKLCEKIQDNGIKKTCQNRLIEEIY